ncbi:hypothetical protein [[Kitasatospora] papulosa]|uniref:hypothetical protein n=1 Tax=[Kitasatospora] papulosa TaxID=1464011 RepID=UPI0036887067
MATTGHGHTARGAAAGGDVVARRSGVRGTLLGGAVGDQPGNPVEFLSLDLLARPAQWMKV